jgi:hypothetical protein
MLGLVRLRFPQKSNLPGWRWILGSLDRWRKLLILNRICLLRSASALPRCPLVFCLMWLRGALGGGVRP